MFTGIVEELGTVQHLEHRGAGARLVIGASTVLDDIELGASISVNGCCLTVVAFDDHTWTAEAVPETMARTNLGELAAGDPVNLERPLAAGGRFGGHIVQGHVDATTTVTSVVELDDGSRRMGFAWPPGLDHYIVEKGSIALDGVSLTVAGLVETHAPGGFEVAVIPHTLAHTTLGQRTVDSTVNVEIDVLAKHVERLLAAGHTQETS